MAFRSTWDKVRQAMEYVVECLGGTHIIEGFVHFGHDVESIENIHSVDAALADDPQVRLPHVRADEFNAFGQRLADEGEELLETLDGAILADPQQSRAALLDLVDQGQILVTFGVLDLIDADRLDRSETAVLEPPRRLAQDGYTRLPPALSSPLGI